jgi:hypothetical protein
MPESYASAHGATVEESGKILPRVFVCLSRVRFGSGSRSCLVEARLVPLEVGASTAVSDVESTKETVEAAAAEAKSAAEAAAKSAVPVVPGNTTLETSATKPTSGA